MPFLQIRTGKHVHGMGQFRWKESVNIKWFPGLLSHSRRKRRQGLNQDFRGEWRCILYIVRRTQLYLDDHLWKALHDEARSRKTTVSALVREAARERYLGKRDEQRKAMQEFVGSRKRSSDTLDSVEYVRNLRRGGRLDRLEK
jgi:hypothetical protein